MTKDDEAYYIAAIAAATLNLAASNINIATDKSNDTRVTISGSNLNATDMLNIDTHNLHIIASTDTTNSNRSFVMSYRYFRK